MDRLPVPQRAIVEALLDDLRDVAGVCAVVLGGSHARGRATPHSDVDLGLLYDEQARFGVDALRGVAARYHDGGDPVVTGFYTWGPWVNGGAWLAIRGQRVDLLYRSFDHVARVWEDACAGRFELHAEQQPPFGYFGPTLLGEIAACVPLYDPEGRVAALQAQTATYPEALRAAVVQWSLWSVDFGLGFADAFARRGDPYGVLGCLARFAHRLALGLFALNRTHFLNDKTALDEIEGFARAPADFASRVRDTLAGRAELPEKVAAFRGLFDEARALAGPLYVRPAAPPDRV